MTNHKPAKTRRWHFDWRLLVFSGLLLPLLVTLGFWQLDRAAEKQAQMDRWQQESEVLTWSAQLTEGLEEGQPVEVRGRYSDRHHWLLDNRTRDGRPGYEVLTIFYPRAGRPVVVNRGWVAALDRRQQLPEIPTPESEVVLAGRLSEFPEPPVLAGSASETGWPKRVQALSPEQARDTEKELADMVIRLASPGQSGAFTADWAPDRMGAQTHYGYAAQWFSLALALVVLTLIASYKKPDSKV